MNVQILTIFPEIFSSFLECSLIKKARDRGLLSVALINIRDYASPPHYNVDDTPYGGGAGMTMKPEPLYDAISAARERRPSSRVILLTPRGVPFNQKKAEELASLADLIFVCGRYEGIDERVVTLCVDEEISLGDFVLMGGEVAAMAILEASVRLCDGVVGNADSIKNESFSGGAHLEAPQYTRPPEFRGERVPEVLLSGNHAQISAWREEQSLAITRARRPDLMKR